MSQLLGETLLKCDANQIQIRKILLLVCLIFSKQFVIFSILCNCCPRIGVLPSIYLKNVYAVWYLTLSCKDSTSRPLMPESKIHFCYESSNERNNTSADHPMIDLIQTGIRINYTFHSNFNGILITIIMYYVYRRSFVFGNPNRYVYTNSIMNSIIIAVFINSIHKQLEQTETQWSAIQNTEIVVI